MSAKNYNIQWFSRKFELYYIRMYTQFRPFSFCYRMTLFTYLFIYLEVGRGRLLWSKTSIIVFIICVLVRMLNTASASLPNMAASTGESLRGVLCLSFLMNWENIVKQFLGVKVLMCVHYSLSFLICIQSAWSLTVSVTIKLKSFTKMMHLVMHRCSYLSSHFRRYFKYTLGVWCWCTLTGQVVSSVHAQTSVSFKLCDYCLKSSVLRISVWSDLSHYRAINRNAGKPKSANHTFVHQGEIYFWVDRTEDGMS